MTELVLSAEFGERMVSVFGDAGRDWVQRFPALLREAATRFGIEIDRAYPGLSYNFVAHARRGREPVVLKLGVPNPDLSSEMEAMRLLRGEGAARLLDADPEAGMLLLERIEPGTPLAEIEDDDRAMCIAAETMQRLWRPAPAEHPFRSVSRWTAKLPGLPEITGGGTGPIPASLWERAVEMCEQLQREAIEPVFMHGDFHQFNVLQSKGSQSKVSQSKGSEWKAIDAKGAVGDPGFEVGPVLSNLLFDCDDPARRLRDRVRRLASETGLKEDHLMRWGFVHSALSACWSIDDGQPVDEAIARLRLIEAAL